jgi:hypothetical protein
VGKISQNIFTSFPLLGVGKPWVNPKIPIWVNFGGSFYGGSWYRYFMAILGLLYDHMAHFVAICYILWSYFPLWNVIPRKIRQHWSGPGVDVMITIFSDFRQYSAKKLAFFSKTNVMIKILHNLALFWVKNANFSQQFLAKIFKKS